MSKFQLPGSEIFDSQILIHSCTPNNYVSMAKKIQNICLRMIRKHGVIDQEKYRKISSKIKWTNIEYHIHYNTDVAHKDLKMYFITNPLPALPICGSHTKPRGETGLSKHYHFQIFVCNIIIILKMILYVCPFYFTRSFPILSLINDSMFTMLLRHIFLELFSHTAIIFCVQECIRIYESNVFDPGS